MRINFAHIRERAAAGGWIDFAVFDAKSTSGTDSANATLLSQLTNGARLAGKRIDQSALAYTQSGQLRFYGSKHLVEYLARGGLPAWTNWIDI